LGREGSRQIEQDYKVDVTSPDAERVKKIGARILPHVDQREVPYSFKVLESPEINAVSLPGGPIYIFRGLIDLIGEEDDDALACVIGHEIGHVNGRHAARQISSQLLTSLLIGFGVPGGTNQDLARIAAGLISLRYSREDELDADRRGLSYAYYAGYDPNGMIRVFKKFEQVERRMGGERNEWLRSHPLNTSRLDRTEVLIENKNYRYGK
jgi:predicted Zn-dependent protease